ncbi:tetratricopeptide repeat protein, partial [Providencia sp. PROV271]|uniref:tetratricopeptide repeat protein n=1 Tax=Providencia sp. PROV271 TaxID=2949959 RepID=UPI00234BD3BA
MNKGFHEKFIAMFFLISPVFVEAANCEILDKSLCEAAEQGDVKAQTRLGAMYHVGNEVKKDYHQSFQWFNKAAQQGDSFSQGMLGQMYY